jgi:hypothetical protein
VRHGTGFDGRGNHDVLRPGIFFDSGEDDAVSEATFVSFVPKTKTAKLRRTLQTEDTGELRWREHKTFFGSEFYFSGPAELARRTHEYVTLWLASSR